MKKIQLSLLILAFTFPIILFSQEKQLTIEDASYMNRNIMPKSMRGLAWMGS